MPSRVAAILCLVILSFQGCMGSFTEEDDGDTHRVLIGKTFTISVPSTDGDRVPVLRNEDLVKYLRRIKDQEPGHDVFEFKAFAPGDAEIRIPKEGAVGPPWYTFTARVVLGGSPYY